MKKRLALLLALIVSLTACSSPDLPAEVPEEPTQQSQTQSEDIPIRLAVYERYSLHPVLAENRANLALSPLLYEPLFELDERFQPHGVLCESYFVSEDALVWTFRLQSGVTFSDGTPLTGQIVAAALNTARREGSRYAARLADVAAVTGDESTVTVTLTTPNGSLPALLDIPIALDDSDRPLGTGPYVLTGTDGALTLTARPGHWRGETAPLEHIPLKPVTKSDELILSFESGDVALVDVDLMGTNSLGYSGSYEVWDYATTSLLYLGFNTASGLCRDARVRQALALGIDRESIAQVDFARHAVPSTLPVHPDSTLYDRSLARGLEYDPEGLSQRLEELRLTGTRSYTLTLLVNSENAARLAAADRIAQQLRWTGLKVELKKLPFEDYAAALAAGDFDLYLGEVVLTADFDLSQLLLPDGSLNYGRWSDGEIEGLLHTLRTAQDVARSAAADALYGYLAQEVPIAPVCFKNGCVLTRWGRLSGLQPVRGNVFYRMSGWNIM